MEKQENADTDGRMGQRARLENNTEDNTEIIGNGERIKGETRGDEET